MGGRLCKAAGAGGGTPSPRDPPAQPALAIIAPPPRPWPRPSSRARPSSGPASAATATPTGRPRPSLAPAGGSAAGLPEGIFLPETNAGAGRNSGSVHLDFCDLTAPQAGGRVSGPRVSGEGKEPQWLSASQSQEGGAQSTFARRPDGPGPAAAHQERTVFRKGVTRPSSACGGHTARYRAPPGPAGVGVGVRTCHLWTWGSAPPLAYCARAPSALLGDSVGTLNPVQSPCRRLNPIAFQTLASPQKPL